MTKINQSTYARVFKMLMDDPVTAHEVVEETGLHLITAQRFMRTLRKHRVVHIAAWESDRRGRDATPVYKLGVGRDVPRRRLSRAEVARRYRERCKLREQQAALTGVVAGMQPAF